ncbi:MAG: acyl-CoA dehydrogenase family protein [Rhodoferax sp.]|uniref:acyl-CoA dehydrogenase family protein n=1 Tax=Rhodoferax sp. TaxID=50421 RepID=UPI00272266B0|nr:acyl-CoA dehydrogenase family protein [Rhodoferax sp.]MDO8449444.1 acyl-CoA dehydrogenase family protein [Rhodoferax sp.]
MNVNLELKDPEWGKRAVDTIRNIAVEYKDEIDDCLKNGKLPLGSFRELGKQGLIGVVTPQELGGYGGSAPEYCLVTETIARHGLPSTQAQVQGQIWILIWGTPEQKTRYLPGMSAGTIVFSESISEPGAGSSLKNMQTTAKRDGDDWIINGKKIHINGGAACDVTVVFAMAEEGMTAFLVDTRLAGFRAEVTDPLGYRLALTADMYFDNVRVPNSAVLGAPGQAMATFLTTFNVSRLGNASELIGQARRALSDGIRYAKQRNVGDSKVTDFQGIQWTIADCYSALYGASAVRDHAANLVRQGKDHALESSIAKKLAIEAAEKSVNEVFSLVGSHGLYWDQPYGQILLDVKTLRVAGGSLEIMKNFIARQVLKDEQQRGLA